MDPNSPLTLIDWKLTPIPGANDKYDKKIIGKVKNNSERNLSEVRIEFTVYNEKGAQIAIVSQNTYDFRPGGIWNFALLVTHDVEKAKLKGLYHVLQRSNKVLRALKSRRYIDQKMEIKQFLIMMKWLKITHFKEDLLGVNTF